MDSWIDGLNVTLMILPKQQKSIYPLIQSSILPNFHGSFHFNSVLQIF
jgi:hypothetical protein